MRSPRPVTGPCGTADPGRRRKSMPLDRSCFSFQIDLAFWFFLFYWRLQNCLFVGLHCCFLQSFSHPMLRLFLKYPLQCRSNRPSHEKQESGNHQGQRQSAEARSAPERPRGPKPHEARFCRVTCVLPLLAHWASHEPLAGFRRCPSRPGPPLAARTRSRRLVVSSPVP